MPTYKVDDGEGHTLTLEGDSPPTEQELEEIFSQFSGRMDTTPPKAMIPGGFMDPGDPRSGEFTQALFSELPADVGAAMHTAMQPLEQVGARVLDTMRGATIPFRLALGQSPMEAFSTPLAEPGKSIIPGLTPEDSDVGAIASLRRAGAGFTTPGSLLALPYAPESNLVQGGFGAGALASIPPSLQALAQAQTGAETRGALTDIGISSAIAGGIGRSLTRERTPYARSQQQAAEVHGDLRSQPIEGEGQMPAQEGRQGVQSSRAQGSQAKVPLEQELQQLSNDPEATGRKFLGFNSDGTPRYEEVVVNARKRQRLADLTAIKEQFEMRRQAAQLSPEEQAYIDAEREAIDTPIEIVPEAREGDPFASNRGIEGQFMGINRAKGTIEVYPEEFKLWLDSVPVELRAGAVKARLAEERIHLATDDAAAGAYWSALTGLEKKINERRYLGQRSRAGITDTMMGHEALRFRLQQLARMTPSEVAETVGREKWTIKGLTIVETAIRGIRRALGTKASEDQRAILDRIQVNLNQAKAAMGAERPGAVRRDTGEPDLEKVGDDPRDVIDAADGAFFSLRQLRASGADKYEVLDRYEALLDFINERADTEFDAGRRGDDLRQMIQTRNAVEEWYKNDRGPAAIRRQKSTEYKGEEMFAPDLLRASSGFAKARAAASGDERVVAEADKQLYKEAQRIGQERGPAAIRRGLTKAEEARETARRKIYDLRQAVEAGKAIPATQHSAELHYTPATPQALDAAAAKVLSSERPSFKDFATYVRMNHGDVEPGALTEMWQDQVWKQLQGMSGKQLEGLVDQLQLRRNVLGSVKNRGVPRADYATLTIADPVTGAADIGIAKEKATKRADLMMKLADQLESKANQRVHDLSGHMNEKEQFEISQARQRAKFLRDRAEDVIASSRKGEGLTYDQPTLGLSEQWQSPATTEASKTSAQKLRAKAISAIGMKLAQEAAAPRKSLTRTDITTDDLRWTEGETAYQAVPSDLDPVLTAQMLVRGAGTERSTKVPIAGGKAVQHRSALPESATKRITTVLDTLTKKVYQLSTYRHGRKGVVMLDPVAPGNQHRPLESMMTRYKPLFSSLLDAPVQNFRREFENLDAYNEQFGNDAKARSEQAGFGEAGVRAPEDFTAEGTEGLEGQGAYISGPEAGIARAEAGMVRGALESGAELTPAEARSAYQAFRNMERPQDADALIESLAKKAQANELKPADWMLINAIRKVAEASTAQPPESALDTLYGLAKKNESEQSFVSSTQKRFAPESAVAPEVEAGQTGREITMADRVAPTVVRPEQVPPGSQPTRVTSQPRTEAREPVTQEQYKHVSSLMRKAARERRLIEDKYGKAGPDLTERTEILGSRGPAALNRNLRRAGRTVTDAIRDTGSSYDEWMVNRIARRGGPVSEQAAEVFKTIIDREKQLYGTLTTKLDEARRAAGQLNKATTWLHGLQKVTGYAATSRTVGAIERTLPVPPEARALVDMARDVNIDIGRMVQPVSPGFVASGKFQRNPTAVAYDAIRAADGDIYRKWTAGLAKANGRSLRNVRAMFREWKEALDTPGVDPAIINKINQDFQRQLPKVITHVKSGGQWVQVVHSDLFNYLENAARRATHTRAFRESFPNDTAGRRTLRDVVEALRSELDAGTQKDVDAMIATMQGHPTDNYSSMGFMSPTAPIGQVFRTLNNTVGNLMAKMVLTSQVLTQTGELAAGATAEKLGMKNYLRGAAKVRQLYPQLETDGSVNRVIYDMSFDPNSPIRSLFRQGGNVLSRVFAERAMNEFQEAAAAATAHVVTERIKNGTLTDWERRNLPQTFYEMGFKTTEVGLLMAGDPQMLGQFQRSAASFLTSGNKSTSEGSRLGANRLFNSVFRFQSYPMMKANQLRQVFGNFAEAWQPGGTKAERIAASERVARFMFFNTMQGALTVAMTTLGFSGKEGLKIKGEEAKDEPLSFLAECFMASMSGPLYVVWRGMRYKGVAGVGEQATRLIFPYTAVRELMDASSGHGQYRDLDTFDRIGKFLQSKTPGTKAIATGLAAFGVASESRDLDTSISAFYRWRRDELGFSESEDFLNEDKRRQFRIVMRKAVEAAKKGDMEKFSEHYVEALSSMEGATTKSVKASLRARKVLKTPDGKELTLEQKESLRQRIGDDAVDRIEYFDAMLEALAK